LADDTTTDAVSDEGTEPEPATPGAVATLTDDQEAVLARLREVLGDAVIEAADLHGGLVVRVAPNAWGRAAHICRAQLGLDYLSFISGIDWMPAPLVAEEGSGDTSAPVQPREETYGVTGSAGRFQVFAHVESTHQPRSGLTLKTDVDDAAPTIESWVTVYPGADWHERECWEMYGFVFEGHPALRHLYLPSEFEGHPLRKDFPLLAREVKPWPGLVDVEPMPGEAGEEGTSGEAPGDESATEASE
jgi:NADH-quinone oxidoreductase subunit C